MPDDFLGTGTLGVTLTPEAAAFGSVNGPAITLSTQVTAFGPVNLQYHYNDTPPAPAAATWALAGLGIAMVIGRHRRTQQVPEA